MADIGVANLTASEVKGFGEYASHAEIHQGAEYKTAFMPMVKTEAVVADDMGERVVAAIHQASGAGPNQPSKVWVCEVLSEETAWPAA